MDFLLISCIGYLIGSVPFALVIGMVFYYTDVRLHGSGNLGGSNTGRVLGKKAGLSVMTLDLLKSTLVVWLSMQISDRPSALALGGVSAALGHCYPVFAKFRGGKAVATMYGFLFGLWILAGHSPLLFFFPLITFVLVLFLFKIVSLSSMVSALVAVGCVWLNGAHPSIIAATAVFALLVLIRHRGNIQRMLKGTENKIHWM